MRKIGRVLITVDGIVVTADVDDTGIAYLPDGREVQLKDDDFQVIKDKLRANGTDITDDDVQTPDAETEEDNTTKSAASAANTPACDDIDMTEKEEVVQLEKDDDGEENKKNKKHSKKSGNKYGKVVVAVLSLAAAAGVVYAAYHICGLEKQNLGTPMLNQTYSSSQTAESITVVAKITDAQGVTNEILLGYITPDSMSGGRNTVLPSEQTDTTTAQAQEAVKKDQDESQDADGLIVTGAALADDENNNKLNNRKERNYGKRED